MKIQAVSNRILRNKLMCQDSQILIYQASFPLSNKNTFQHVHQKQVNNDLKKIISYIMHVYTPNPLIHF